MATASAELFVRVNADLSKALAGLRTLEAEVKATAKRISQAQMGAPPAPPKTPPSPLAPPAPQKPPKAPKTPPAPTISEHITNVGKAVTNFGNRVESAGRAATAALTLPIVGAGVVILNQFEKWEDGVAGFHRVLGDISKTDLSSLTGQIRSMALEKGMPSAVSLIGTATTLAQQGVPQDQIIEATRQFAMIQKVAPSLAGPEGADLFAKALNAGRVTRAEGGAFASSFLASSTYGASNESELLQTFGRSASTGLSAGLTTPQLMGIANAATSAGTNQGAEAIGTDLNKLFQTMLKSEQPGKPGELIDNSKKIREGRDKVADLNTRLKETQLRGTQVTTRTNPAALQANADEQAKLKREIAEANTDLGTLRAENGKPKKKQADDLAALFGKGAGVSEAEWRKLVKDNPEEAMEKFLTGVAGMDDVSGDKLLTDLKLDAARTGPLMRALAGNQLEKKDGGKTDLASFIKVSTDASAGGDHELQRQHDIASDTLSSDVAQGWAKVTEQQLRLGEILAPSLAAFLAGPGEQFVRWLASAVTWFTQLSPHTQKWVEILVGIAAVVGPLLALIGAMAGGVGAIITVIGAVGVGIGAAIGVIGTVAGVIGTALGGAFLSLVTIVTIIGEGFASLAGIIVAAISLPILIIGLLIAAVALLGIAWVKDWGHIREHTAESVHWIGDRFSELGTKANEVWEGIHTRAAEWGEQIKTKVGEWVGALKGVFGGLETTVQTIFNAIYNKIADFVVQLSKTPVIGKSFEGAAQFLDKNRPRVDVPKSAPPAGANAQAGLTVQATFTGDINARSKEEADDSMSWIADAFGDAMITTHSQGSWKDR